LLLLLIINVNVIIIYDNIIILEPLWNCRWNLNI
jgi:hypothetical protein